MDFLLALEPVAPLIIGTASFLWAVAAWLRIKRLAYYFQCDKYNIKRYSERMKRVRQERREMINAVANIFSIGLMGMLLAMGHYDMPGVVTGLAIYCGCLGLIDIFVRPTDHRRDRAAFLPLPQTIRILRIAYGIGAIPFALYTLALLLSYVTPLNRNVVMFLGIETAAIALLLAPMALPLASMFTRLPGGNANVNVK